MLKRVSARVGFAVIQVTAMVVGCGICQGQGISVAQLSLKDTTAAELYAYVPNRIRITGLKRGDRVHLGQSPPARTDTSVFTFRPDRLGNDTLFVKRRGRLVFSQSYPVGTLPDPLLHVGGVKNKRGATATVNEILADPRLTIDAGNYSSWFRVISFELSIQSKDGIIGPIEGRGDLLSPNHIVLIRQLRSGDKIYVENIRASCPECSIRRLNSFTIQIK